MDLPEDVSKTYSPVEFTVYSFSSSVRLRVFRPIRGVFETFPELGKNEKENSYRTSSDRPKSRRQEHTRKYGSDLTVFFPHVGTLEPVVMDLIH